MLQKILKIGNSYGVTIPREFVDKNKLKTGSKVDVDYKIPKSTKYETVSDKEFLKIVKDIELQYGKALDDLVNL